MKILNTSKKLLFFTVLFLISISHSVKINAQNLQSSNQRIESFNSEQGFNQNTVNAIISDAKGYLWVGTPNGLVRYDGYSFEYYYHDYENLHSLNNNFVSHLLSDSKGRVWVGTRDGISIYLTDKEKFLPLKNTIKKNICIKEDSKNRVFVVGGKKIEVYKTSNEDLEKVDKITEINLEKVLKKNTITDIEFYSNSEILVSTKTKIYKVDFKEDYTFDILELQLDESINDIKKIIKVDNSLWIGTSLGIYQTFIENSRLITVGSHFTSNGGNAYNILSLYLDKEKKLWIGTKKNGIVCYDAINSQFKSFKFQSKYNNGLTSNRINCFFEDAYGVLWIGTAQGGLNKFDKNQKPFQNYSHNPYDDKSLSSNLITDITEASDGKIWLSFFESVISRTDEKLKVETVNQIHFKRLEKQLSKLKNQWVLRLYQDYKGYWWISTNEGLYFYDEKTDNLKNIKISVDGEFVSPVFYHIIEQINSNQMILGGSKIMMLNNPWEAILNNKPIKAGTSLFNIGNNNQINEYLKDDFGNFWFATINGVYRVSIVNNKWLIKNHISTIPDKNQLKISNNRVLTIHKSLNKEIWLGTFGGGLMKIQLNTVGEPIKIKGYHKKDGLRDEAIYGILEDNNKQLWLSTDMGIGRFDPVKETFDFYDVNNGILSNNFRQSAYLKTRNGTMLMGGVGGLTVFNPSQIIKNEITPKILISRLKINNQPIVAGEKINNEVILERSISDTQKLVIDNNSRNISLDIIVQHSATPNKNKLAYKLKGVNNDWIEIDAGKTTATYTNLSSGTYTFLYKGANGDGVWTADTKSFTIEVLAPWYARWWSITLWISLFGLITFGIFKYLVKVEKLNQKLKYEELDKQRIEIVNQGKFRYFTNLSHEFRTPLTLIAGPLERIMEQNSDASNNKYLAIIQKNTKRLLSLVDQLVTFRQAEQGFINLKLVKFALGDFIYPTTEAFENYALEKNINFFYKVTKPNEEIIIDVEKVERIIFNLLSNAFKNTPSQGNISIEAGTYFKDGEKIIEISVVDSGKGIPEENLKNIFERFYQLGNSESDVSGGGIGLAFCKSLVKILEGEISATSTPGVETRFTVKIPSKELKDYDVETGQESKKSFIKNWLPLTNDIINEEVQLSLSNNKKEHSILIVENEVDVQHFLFSTLSNKYEIIIANNGVEGLEKINIKNPDLIISDVMMPEMDGFELCNKIKSNSKTCHIPVLLLTALGDNEDIVKGLEFGADEYLSKPFSLKHLELRISKLIKNSIQLKEYFAKNSDLPKENDTLEISEKDKEFLQKIIEIIEKNLSNSNFGVEELSKEIGLSTSHFYRRLKQLTGQVPNVYIRNFRLQRAAQLLATNKGFNVAEVMYQIGIESNSYFSASFKKLHGMSPSEYLKKHANK